MKIWQASVSRLLTFSCVDGPGNRLVLFLQGCNFHCPTCHNPHTIGRCDHCGECVSGCPATALSWQDGRVVWNDALCIHCDHCLAVCPRSASPKTRTMTVADVIDVLRRYALLLNGITVSGGEATTQLPFVLALFAAIKAAPDLAHLTCLVDSNGYLPEEGWQKLLPVCDGVMVDLKGWKEPVHQALTGRSGERVRHAIEFLARHQRLAELRLLHVPGRSDFEHHLPELVAWLQQLGPVPLRLNGFRQHGVRGEAAKWPAATRSALEQLESSIRNLGWSGSIALPVL